MLPSMFFNGQLFVIFARKFVEKNCSAFSNFFSQRFFQSFYLLLQLFNRWVLFSFLRSIDWYTFQNSRSAFLGRKSLKMRTTIRFLKSRVIVFSIEKSRTFRIWRKKEIVEKVERSLLYKMV
jgi:hypothetical protein